MRHLLRVPQSSAAQRRYYTEVIHPGPSPQPKRTKMVEERGAKLTEAPNRALPVKSRSTSADAALKQE